MHFNHNKQSLGYQSSVDPTGAEPILGVVALENTGLVVDPVTKTLRRLHAKPLK